MSKELKEIVAKNISELRVACKLTQLELGRELSYSDKAVSKWERGEAIPDAYVLLQMSKIFGVTVDYILSEHGENDSPKTVIKKSFTNHFVVTLIAITGVWTLATLLYIILALSGIVHTLVFMYATVVSMVVLTVFNSMWGKRIFNLLIISGLVWSILLTLYLIFRLVGYRFGLLLFLGIPAQVIIVLCFGVRREKLHFRNILKKSAEE